MTALGVKRILFSGYAPVHFVCFLPVLRELENDKRIEIWLSGGFLKKLENGSSKYVQEGFYDPFDINQRMVIPVEQSKKEDFDVLVCAHLSTDLFPGSAKKTVQIFHGVSFKNFAVREKSLKYDILCLPGNYHAGQYRKRGLIRKDGSVCLITGFPKVDALVGGKLNQRQILKKIGLDPKFPTILYAPTGNKKNSLETMGREVIEKLAANTSWNLLIKPHDHPKNKKNWFAKLAPFENERVRLVRDKDVVPYLFAADLLITDASSVSFEYTVLDRPIIFLDTPVLLQKAIEKGAAVDLETYGRKIGFTLVKEPEQIVAAVAGALAEPQKESVIRSKAAKDMFYKIGGASARVAEVIRYAAGLKKDLGADIQVLDPDKDLSL